MTRLENSFKIAHGAMNYDFCPWANRWVYWVKHPLTCVGAAAMVAACCGAFVNPVGFAFVGVILLIGVLGALWPWMTARGLTAQAEFLQTRCRVGQSVVVRLRIVNRLPWSAWGLSIRHGFHEIGDDDSGIALARVAGWSETEFEWLYRPSRRGVFPFKTPLVDTGFPFGLWNACVPINLGNELVVWPHSVSVDVMPDAAEIMTREDQLTDRRTGHAGDLVGVRPFREGDSLRRIHWQQTARTGRLIVIERQAPATCAVRLVVEVAQNHHSGHGLISSLEQTLSVAASVLESLHRLHAFVEVEVHEQQIQVGESKGDLRRALDALARVPVEGIRCDHACHFDQPSRSLPTIAVTTDVALAHHRGHRHTSAGERYIVIRTMQENKFERIQSACDCHAWMEISTEELISEVFPIRWRRACNAS